MGAGALLFGSTGYDDAYITYWAARALAETGQIVNYDGQAVEQSSSVLHVVVLAATYLVTSLPLPVLGLAVGLLGGVATTLLAALVADRAEPFSAVPAALVTGSTAYLVYWSFGGLETTLAAAALLAVALAAASVVERGMSARSLTVFGAAALAQVTVRPEGGLVLLAAFVGWVVLHRRSTVWRVVLVLAGITVASMAVVALARLAYFGVLVPQPVRSKFGGISVEHLGWGLGYARTWLTDPVTLVVAAVAVTGVCVGPTSGGRRGPVEPLLWALAGAQICSVVAAGGDAMPIGRLLVPGVTALAVLAGVGVVRSARLIGSRPARIVAGLLVLVQLAGIVLVARRYSTGQPYWVGDAAVPGVDSRSVDRFSWIERRNRIHLRDAAFVPQLDGIVGRLSDQLHRPVVVASGQAGMLTYYLAVDHPHEVRFVDRARLVGDDFAGCDDLAVQQQTGDMISYERWFGALDRCGAPEPDVIFDLALFETAATGSGHYTVVYRQVDAPVRSGSALLPGARVSTGQFVAVRTDLVPVVLQGIDG